MNIINGIVNLFRFDKTNWKAVALCLVAATVFWFFNALNKEHTATVAYPIEFRFDSARFIPVKALPQQVLLNVSGSGWDLLRKSLGLKVTPLRIKIERPLESITISPANMLSAAAAQFGQTKINHVASDTLFLSIEPRKSKKVKLVLSRNQLRFELGFGISSTIMILPDSIMVEGPSSSLSKMPDSILLLFPPGRISNHVKEELEIAGNGENFMTMSPSTAIVMFEVSELTDVPKKVKVVVLPAFPFRHQASADSISITVRLPKKQKEEIINSSGLFAVIDLRAIEPGITKLVPSFKGLPSFSKVVLADSLTIRKY